ncbi:MAG: hypothetical protein AAGB12_09815 [Pseudomonadota bacterium]
MKKYLLLPLSLFSGYVAADDSLKAKSNFLNDSTTLTSSIEELTSEWIKSGAIGIDGSVSIQSMKGEQSGGGFLTIPGQQSGGGSGNVALAGQESGAASIIAGEQGGGGFITTANEESSGGFGLLSDGGTAGGSSGIQSIAITGNVTAGNGSGVQLIASGSNTVFAPAENQDISYAFFNKNQLESVLIADETTAMSLANFIEDYADNYFSSQLINTWQSTSSQQLLLIKTPDGITLIKE